MGHALAVWSAVHAAPCWCWRLVAGTGALELLAWCLDQPARDRLAALRRQHASCGRDS